MTITDRQLPDGAMVVPLAKLGPNEATTVQCCRASALQSRASAGLWNGVTRLAFALVAFCVAGKAQRVWAAPTNPAQSGAPGGTCTVGQNSALSEIACELRRAIPANAHPVTVFVSELTSTKSMPRQSELVARATRVFAGTLGADATGLPSAQSLALTRAIAGKGRLLLALVLDVEGGELRVSADLYGKSPGFWDRVRTAAPGPVVHAFASRRIDGEIASFLPTTPLVVTSVERGALGPGDTVAMACGDVDRDGALDVVVVGRRKIQVGRVRKGRFGIERESSWSTLSKVASAPLREPIGSVFVRGTGGIRVGVTDREHAVDLSQDLSLERKLDDAVPWPLIGCIGENGSALVAPGPCVRDETGPVDVSDVGEADAVAAGHWVTPAGVSITAAAFRSPHDQSVTLRDSAGRAAKIPSAGAALALGDLDRDGRVEIVTSVDTLDPKSDAIIVSTWADATIRERYRVAVPDGAVAVATCPPDGQGPSPLVVASSKELIVIR